MIKIKKINKYTFKKKSREKKKKKKEPKSNIMILALSLISQVIARNEKAPVSQVNAAEVYMDFISFPEV